MLIRRGPLKKRCISDNTLTATVVAASSKKARTTETMKASTTGTMRDDAWNANYVRLVQYRKKNGDCLVPRGCDSDPKLGRWVSMQRQRRTSLSDERIKKLEDIGFVWSVQKRDTFDVMCARLVAYREEHGDCLVPKSYNSDPKLGRWVAQQRAQKKRGTLLDDRVTRLESIGFAWAVTRRQPAQREIRNYEVEDGVSEEECI